jgi:hypothetical protein
MHQEILMESSEKTAPKEFLDRLRRLFTDIETWVQSRNMQVVRSKMTLNEEAYGEYEVDKLSLTREGGRRIADVVPAGASVIGARGLVDLVGTIDQEILVYLDKDGPCITTAITDGDHKQTHTTPLYRGIEEAGWYWIESRKLSRGRKLDEALFLDLLTEVSDYECR